MSVHRVPPAAVSQAGAELGARGAAQPSQCVLSLMNSLSLSLSCCFFIVLLLAAPAGLLSL